MDLDHSNIDFDHHIYAELIKIKIKYIFNKIIKNKIFNKSPML
jgi:hypothetical protein